MKKLLISILLIAFPLSVLAAENSILVTGRLARMVDGKEEPVRSGLIKIGYYDQGILKFNLKLVRGKEFVIVPGTGQVNSNGFFTVIIDKKDLDKLPINLGISYLDQKALLDKGEAILKTEEGIPISFEITDEVKQINLNRIFGNIMLREH